MSIRKTPLVSGEYYHIYNRGNSKQKIFHDHEDYTHFIALLYACNQKENFKVDNLHKGESLYDIERGNALVSVGAYALMPNHFHLLITERENGSISKFIQKLSTAYVMYYNKKYERTGGLFEGKFKSQHPATDRYLKYLFSYIYLNALKLKYKHWREKGIINKKASLNFLKKYSYSSFPDQMGTKRTQAKILSMESFPKYFRNKVELKREIFDWLSYGEPELLR